MRIKEGDHVTSGICERDYIIERIERTRVLLKQKNGEREVITDIDALAALYRKQEPDWIQALYAAET